MRNTDGRHKRELIWVATFAFAAAVVYALLNRAQHAPTIYPDEIYFGQIARSLAHHGQYAWRGADIGVHSLYPFVIAPAWLLNNNEHAYTVALWINAALASATAIPMYLMARSLASRNAALAVTALLFAGSWMVMSGRLMTESLAWPLTTAVLACLVLALQRADRARLIYAAMAFAAAAAATRLQLGILLAVIPTALLIDLLRRGSAGRQQWTAAYRRPAVAAISVVILAVLAALIAPGRTLGSYSVAVHGVNFADLLWWTSNNVVELALMVGIVPLVVLIALMFSRSNWRDPRIGPFLSVALPACAAVLGMTGWFLAGGTPRLIDRYLIYLAPLALAALPAAVGRVRMLHVTAISLLLALLVVAYPLPTVPLGESIALYGAIIGFFGWPDPAPGQALTYVAVVIFVMGIAGGALLQLIGQRPQNDDIEAADDEAGTPRSRGMSPARTATAATCALVVLLLGYNAVVSTWAWRDAHALASYSRAFLPPDLQWVDGSTYIGRVAILYAAPTPPESTLGFELFNDSITRAYRIPPVKPGDVPYGVTCPLEIEADGTLRNDRSAPALPPKLCPPPPISMLIVGERTQVSIRNQSAKTTNSGSRMPLVITRGSPQLFSRVSAICADDKSCAEFAKLEYWSPQRSTVRLQFIAGNSPIRLTVADKVVAVKANGKAIISLDVKRGYNGFAVKLGKRPTRAQLRSVARINLIEDGRRETIFTRPPVRSTPDVADLVPR
ncbi:MAG: hypothetical protein JHC87_04635 [Thermoleophilaceae bacterium]|nr:hypothetical protein [Thermoleophilaceae bacterium]